MSQLCPVYQSGTSEAVNTLNDSTRMFVPRAFLSSFAESNYGRGDFLIAMRIADVVEEERLQCPRVELDQTPPLPPLIGINDFLQPRKLPCSKNKLSQAVIVHKFTYLPEFERYAHNLTQDTASDFAFVCAQEL